MINNAATWRNKLETLNLIRACFVGISLWITFEQMLGGEIVWRQ
jgi:hypothetical protein